MSADSKVKIALKNSIKHSGSEGVKTGVLFALSIFYFFSIGGGGGISPSLDIRLETKTEKEYLGNRRVLFSLICGDAMPPVKF